MTASSQRTKPLDQAASDRSIRRIKQLMTEDMSYQEMADVLNQEGYRTIRLLSWTALNIRQVVFKIRHNESSWYGLSAKRANLVVAEVKH
jgi:hypothetical protein